MPPLKLQSFRTACKPLLPFLVTKAPGMSMTAVDSITLPECPRQYIFISRTFLVPLFLHIMCIVALCCKSSHSCYNIARVSLHLAWSNVTLTPSHKGSNDVIDNSTFDNADLVFTLFSLYHWNILSLYALSSHRNYTSCWSYHNLHCPHLHH